MGQVTVEQLAEVVGASSERLLTQMKEAGLPHTDADEAVSDDDKQTLLQYLKRSHGESTEAPKRITLEAQNPHTLRASASQGRKTVNVEVRKKRTYVKRDAEQGDDAGAAPETELSTSEQKQHAEEVAAQAAAAVEAKAVAAAEREQLAAAVSELEAGADEDPANLDPEILRQRAAARRKLKEAEEAAARQAAAEARKAAEEQAKARAQPRPRRKLKMRPSDPSVCTRLPSRCPRVDETQAQAAKQTRPQRTTGRGKQRNHNLSLADLEVRSGNELVVAVDARKSSRHMRNTPGTDSKCPLRKKPRKSDCWT